jgi:hypothetical protein
VLRESLIPEPWNDRLDGPLIYRGDINAENTWNLAEPSNSQMNSWGTTAIARTSPTNPSFDLATFLGETVREGLPRISGLELLRDRSKSLRSRAGGEYLNVEFGWKPLVRDLRSFAEVVRDTDNILSQYRRDAGRKIRRRYAFPVVYQAATLGNQFMPDLAYYANYAINGGGTTYRTKQQEVWFSGAFKYHLPLGSSAADKFARFRSEADKLLGISLTPDTVWNLSPWTWAIDWFTNAGDVMRNISNIGIDGLVLEYGYVMARTLSTHQYVYSTTRPGNRVYSGSVRKVREDKRRTPATPYGFGLTTGDLTTRQKAILVALGLTKSG